MKDRKPKYPGRVMLTPVEGQNGVYDMERADEPEEVGTPLNKNTLLKDETAKAMGLDPETNPTLNDALVALMARMLADGNGIMQKMMQMLKGNSDVGIMNGENKKIFGYGTDGKFYIGDSEFPLAFLGSGGVPTYNGVNMPQIQTGTYKGTGKSGSSNKNSLTFNFAPKIVFIYGNFNDIVGLMTTGHGYQRALVSGNGSGMNNEYTYVSWSGNKMSWYGSAATSQMNVEGCTYKYVAIG